MLITVKLLIRGIHVKSNQIIIAEVYNHATNYSNSIKLPNDQSELESDEKYN